MVIYRTKINGKSLRVYVNPWTLQVSIDIDNEEVYSSWELTLLYFVIVIISLIIMWYIGYMSAILVCRC